MKRLIPVILTLFLMSVPVYAGDYEDGIAAGRKGDFKTLVKKLKLAADSGHAQAQFTLGLLYGTGKGVQQNKKESVKWYHKAAEQGHAPAQYSLGMIYFEGYRELSNDQESYKWFSKAAEQGHV